MQALAEVVADLELNRYPDTSGRTLRQVLAERHDCDPERVVLGNGSDEIISILLTALSGRSEPVAALAPSGIRLAGPAGRRLARPTRRLAADPLRSQVARGGPCPGIPELHPPTPPSERKPLISSAVWLIFQKTAVSWS